MSQDMVSFVLRFVREVGEDQQARWRGVIKHVQGDTETSFTQFSEALAFMQAHVNELIRASFSETERLNEFNPLLETTRLWGEMMPRYTKMMSDMMMSGMMGEAAAQPATAQNAPAGAMPPQMEQALAAAFKAWGIPTQAEQERALQSLETMMVRMNELAAKMDALEQQAQRASG